MMPATPRSSSIPQAAATSPNARCRVRSGMICRSRASSSASISAAVPTYRSETIFGRPPTRAISRKYQYVLPLIFFGYRLAINLGHTPEQPRGQAPNQRATSRNASASASHWASDNHDHRKLRLGFRVSGLRAGWWRAAAPPGQRAATRRRSSRTTTAPTTEPMKPMGRSSNRWNWISSQRNPPTNEPTTPSRIVPRQPIGSRPGTRNRASAPASSPTTIHDSTTTANLSSDSAYGKVHHCGRELVKTGSRRRRGSAAPAARARGGPARRGGSAQAVDQGWEEEQAGDGQGGEGGDEHGGGAHVLDRAHALAVSGVEQVEQALDDCVDHLGRQHQPDRQHHQRDLDPGQSQPEREPQRRGGGHQVDAGVALAGEHLAETAEREAEAAQQSHPRCSDPRAAVGLLAQDVGVPGVASGLLDHVHVDPAQRDLAQPPVRPGVVERALGGHRPGE